MDIDITKTTDKEKTAARQRKYRKANREKLLEDARKRYAANKNKERARKKIYAAKKPEAIKGAQNRYYQKHREKIRAKQLVRQLAFREALNSYKMLRGCIDCGYNTHPAALDFDHVTGDKCRDVSLSGSIESALKEAEKCEIRCANCHRIKTFERRNSNKG